MDRRPSIAYLVPLISSELTFEIWKGIERRARELGCDLTIFAGRELSPEGPGSSPENRVYLDSRLADCDGILLYTGALNTYHGPEVYRALLNRLPALPRVHIAATVEGETSVVVDNVQAMEGLTTHLIQAHGCTDLAFIGGPPENEEARDRALGFRAALHAAGLPLPPDRVLPGEFSIHSGIEGVRRLLDGSERPPQAIVCVDDETARGVYSALQARGWKIPADVLVTGFDNAPSSAHLTPPVTTAHQSFSALGAKSLEVLLDLVQDPRRPAQVQRVPARLVLRPSCGCQGAFPSAGGPSPDDYRLLPLAFRTELGTQWNQALAGGGTADLQGFLRAALDEEKFPEGSEEEYLEEWSRYTASLLGEGAPASPAPCLQKLLFQQVFGAVVQFLTQRPQDRAEELDYISSCLHSFADEQTFLARFAEEFGNLHVDQVRLEWEAPRAPVAWTNPRPEPRSDIPSVWVTEPLAFGTTSFGQVRFLCRTTWVDVLDSLAIQLGVSLHRFSLMADAEAKRQALAASLQELQATQADLIKRERQAALGGLVAGIAHEINTPVGTSITAVSFLVHELEKLEKARVAETLTRNSLTAFLASSTQAADSIWRNLNRAAQLIERFKTMAVEYQGDQRHEFSLADHLGLVIAAMEPEYGPRGIRIQCLCPPELRVNAFPNAYHQILGNLISNSLVHGFPNSEPGTIGVEARWDQESDLVLLDYQDNGQGLPPEVVERIFEPFVTSHRRSGTSGLGLHLVYQLATQALGGSVHYDPGQGRGACFRFCLPRQAPV